MIASDGDSPAINSRLTEASERGETLEVILVLRGRVRPARGSGRWRIRVDGRHVLTFRAESVVAATPVARPARSARS